MFAGCYREYAAVFDSVQKLGSSSKVIMRDRGGEKQDSAERQAAIISGGRGRGSNGGGDLAKAAALGSRTTKRMFGF